jgi:N-methylhydantoinase B
MSRRHYWLMLKLTIFMLTHDKSIPLNAGMYRSITARNPAGTIMNAEFPDAVGFRTPVAIRCNDAVTGAILSASDDLLPAPAAGCTSTLVVSEYEEGARQPTVKVLQPMRGGMGAYRGRDGVDGRDVTMNNMRNHPVEVIESESGVIVHDYDIRPDSGGIGRWRGGCGQRMRISVTRPGSRLILRGAERFRFTAWGVAGGGPGAAYRLVLDEGLPTERICPKLDSFHLQPGETLTVAMPGAAGFGDPAERDLAAVARDLRIGVVSPEAAQRDYRVVLAADGTPDEAASRALRARSAGVVAAGFGVGPERRAWEQVFDDATMQRIAALLARYPKAVRHQLRRRIYDTAVPGFVTERHRPLAELLADVVGTRRRLASVLDELERAKGAA